MKKMKSLMDGLIDQLKDLHSAETQLVKALPKVEKKAMNAGLKEAIGSHLLETQRHVTRLEQIGELLQQKLTGKTCKAMQGLIEEGKEVLEEESDNTALIDALLIAAAQRIEHYEIAAYGTAQSFAEELELEEVAKLLQITLDEEMAADEKLAVISEDEVLFEANISASTSESDDSETESKGAGMKRSGGVSGRILSLLSCGAIAMTLSVSDVRANSEDSSNSYRATESSRAAMRSSGSGMTADEQRLSGSETDLLARIRKEIVANESLSTEAHNVNIVVRDGGIFLRGTVKTAQEKSWIADTSARLAPRYKIVNDLVVSAD